MIVYADTSALVKLVIQEAGSDQMAGFQASAESLITAGTAYVELRAAVAAAIRAGRLRATQPFQITRTVDVLWGGMATIAVDDSLLRRAGDLAESMALRAYDAIHLAALLEAGSPASLPFACWDTELRRAAASFGFGLLPDA